jgi:nitroreductase
MDISDLLARNRSFRRFEEKYRLERSTLVELVGVTRLCVSSANRQPLRYLIACTPEETAEVFPCLGWAAALPDWTGPEEGERPAAYIIILGDTRITHTFDCDAGIAAQSILLAATEQGLGGCMIGSINHRDLRTALRIPPAYTIVMAVALGKPAEKVVLDDAKSPDEIVYWRDAAGVHHVPKRPLSELVVKF